MKIQSKQRFRKRMEIRACTLITRAFHECTYEEGTFSFHCRLCKSWCCHGHFVPIKNICKKCNRRNMIAKAAFKNKYLKNETVLFSTK